MQAYDALDLQTESYEWWIKPQAALFADVYLKKRMGSNPRLVEQIPFSIDPKRFAISISDTLRWADTFFVAPDICHAIAMSAASYPEVPLSESDLPSPVGFVMLGEPLTVYATTGDGTFTTTRVTAMMWGSAPKGLFLCAFGEWEPDVRPVVTDREPPMPLIYAIATDWGTPVMTESEIAHALEKYQVPGILDANVTLIKFLPAFWSFISQKIVVSAPVRHRSSERRAAREGLSASGVRLIKLRTTERRTEPGEGTVNWQHSWIVRGHWRKQWYPSQQTHKARYINPYPKGPEDKPLLAHKTLFEIDR